MSGMRKSGHCELPEIAAIVLFDAQKRILLQHRTSDALHFPDYWAFFGGGVEKGESPAIAVSRETLEELGLKLRSPRFFREYLLKEYGAWFSLHLFVNCYRADKSRLSLNEGQGWGWFGAPELIRLKTIPDDLCILLDVARHIRWPRKDCRLLEEKIAGLPHRVYRRWRLRRGRERQG